MYRRKGNMNYNIKSGRNTIHEKEFYWEDPKTGYRIAIARGKESLLNDEELKEILLERIEEYNA